MLTLPKIVEHPAKPYAAVRRQVSIPFDEVIGPSIDELFATLKSQGVEADGPIFFKFNIVKMPELEVEFGVRTKGAAKDDGDFVVGTLPAGRYAELDYFGHYDDLMEVTGLLIGWAKHKGIAWDSTQEADGEHFACRLEIYHNSPEEEPDPQKWHTTLRFKLRD